MKKEELKKYIWIIVMIVFLLTVDQVVKEIVKQFNINNFIVIDEIFKISYLVNDGNLNENKPIFKILSSTITDIIVIAMVIRFMIVQRDKMYKMTQISLSLIVAGGLSNLIDKIFKGGIINYINLQSIIPNFPIFNFADLFIIIGFVIFVMTATINTFELIKIKQKTTI